MAPSLLSLLGAYSSLETDGLWLSWLIHLLQQIDDTVGVMRENINKVSQRGERLDSLQDKTDNLAVSAQGFRRGANRVRKQMWWKDMKMRMCLIVGIIILLIVIIVPAGMYYSLEPFAAVSRSDLQTVVATR